MISIFQWDLVAHKYKQYFEDRQDRISSQVVFPLILKMLGKVKGKRVLDFGCGQGRFSRKLCDLGAIVTAYDISEESLRIAIKLNGSRKITYTNDKRVLNVNYYDIVLCFMVLLCNDIKIVKKLVEDIYNFLKPRGLAVFVNTNTESLGKRFPDFYSIPPKLPTEGAPYKTIIPTSAGDIIVTDYFYSREFLRNLFAEAGLKLICEKVVADQFVVHFLRKV